VQGVSAWAVVIARMEVGLCSLLSVKPLTLQEKTPQAALVPARGKSLPPPVCGRSLRAALSFAQDARALAPHQRAQNYRLSGRSSEAPLSVKVATWCSEQRTSPSKLASTEVQEEQPQYKEGGQTAWASTTSGSARGSEPQSGDEETEAFSGTALVVATPNDDRDEAFSDGGAILAGNEGENPQVLAEEWEFQDTGNLGLAGEWVEPDELEDGDDEDDAEVNADGGDLYEDNDSEEGGADADDENDVNPLNGDSDAVVGDAQEEGDIAEENEEKNLASEGPKKKKKKKKKAKKRRMSSKTSEVQEAVAPSKRPPVPRFPHPVILAAPEETMEATDSSNPQQSLGATMGVLPSKDKIGRHLFLGRFLKKTPAITPSESEEAKRANDGQDSDVAAALPGVMPPVRARSVDSAKRNSESVDEQGRGRRRRPRSEAPTQLRRSQAEAQQRALPGNGLAIVGSATATVAGPTASKPPIPHFSLGSVVAGKKPSSSSTSKVAKEEECDPSLGALYFSYATMKMPDGQKVPLKNRNFVVKTLHDLNVKVAMPICRWFGLRYNFFAEQHPQANKAGNTRKDPLILRKKLPDGEEVQETRHMTTIRLRLRMHPKKGNPQTDFISKGTQMAVLLHELCHLRHMNHGRDFMLFLRDIFAQARKLGVFNPEEMSNELPSSFRWENEIFKSGGSLQDEELLTIFAEERARIRAQSQAKAAENETVTAVIDTEDARETPPAPTEARPATAGVLPSPPSPPASSLSSRDARNSSSTPTLKAGSSLTPAEGSPIEVRALEHSQSAASAGYEDSSLLGGEVCSCFLRPGFPSSSTSSTSSPSSQGQGLGLNLVQAFGGRQCVEPHRLFSSTPDGASSPYPPPPPPPPSLPDQQSPHRQRHKQQEPFQLPSIHNPASDPTSASISAATLALVAADISPKRHRPPRPQTTHSTTTTSPTQASHATYASSLSLSGGVSHLPEVPKLPPIGC